MNKLLLFFLSLSIQVANYFINLRWNWPLLSLSGLRGPYQGSDLAATIELADCDGRTCEGFIYGELLASLLRALFPEVNNIFVASVILTLMLLIMISFIASRAKTISGVILVNVVGISPVTMLLIERVNIDLVILICLFGANQFMQRGRYLPALVITWITTLIKFYTLFAMLTVLVLLIKKSGSGLT